MDAADAEAEEKMLEKICTGDFVAETANDEWRQRSKRAAGRRGSGAGNGGNQEEVGRAGGGNGWG